MDGTRRHFLQVGLAAAVAGFLADDALALRALQPVVGVDNPLETYPDRGWEHIYRDQYRYDATFTYVCSPNDTHACCGRAFVRHGIVTRLEQNYDVERYADLYGNKATPAWHPRMCPKGYTMHRRVYGPYPLRYPIVRRGWKQWANDGFPELTPANKTRYKFDARGQDDFLRLSWDEAYDSL